MSNALSSQPSGSLGSTDLESLIPTSSHGRAVIQPNERVNSPADKEDTTVPGEGFFAIFVSICLEQKDSIGQTWRDSCWGKAKVPFKYIYAFSYVHEHHGEKLHITVSCTFISSCHTLLSSIYGNCEIKRNIRIYRTSFCSTLKLR